MGVCLCNRIYCKDEEGRLVKMNEEVLQHFVDGQGIQYDCELDVDSSGWLALKMWSCLVIIVPMVHLPMQSSW